MRLEKNFTHNVHLQHGMDTEMPTHLARNLSNKEKNTVHITTIWVFSYSKCEYVFEVCRA